MISLRLGKRFVKESLAKLDAYANRRYRAYVYKMFEDMLLVSMQYSGDYTSNWRIVTQNDGFPTYHELPEHNSMQISFLLGTTVTPHQAGDAPAVLAARDAVTRKPFNYKDKVYFMNPTPLHNDGTNVTGPDGISRPLRPVNLINGGETIKAYMQSLYGGRV